MRLIYTKPSLNDLSQGSRIAFVRHFRFMTQDDVSNELGLTGECKRRSMTRYEKGDRNPKEERTKEIEQAFDDLQKEVAKQLANIFRISYNAIKKYDYKEPIDILYTLMWLEEIIPRYYIDLSKVPNINENNIIIIKKFINEWERMRTKRLKREISYIDYIEWKLTYEVDHYE